MIKWEEAFKVPENLSKGRLNKRSECGDGGQDEGMGFSERLNLRHVYRVWESSRREMITG